MTRSARIGGRRLWLGTAVLLVAVILGLRTLSTLLLPGAWWRTAVVLTAAVALVVVVARQVHRSRLVPSAWGLLAAVTGLTALYGEAASGLSVPRPTAETVERLRLLVDGGVQAIIDGRIPVQPTRGIELLVVAGTVATYLVAELLALGLGRAGLAGLALAALWSPAIGFERDGGFWLLFGAGTTYLLLLAVTRPRSRRHDRTASTEVPVATAAAGLTVIALGLGVAAAALPFHGAVSLPTGWGGRGLDSPLRISTDLDMRADLVDRSNRPLLQYTGDGQAISALRMYTLTDFDGREWQPPVASRGSDRVKADDLLWPEPLSAGEAAETADVVEVEILSLSQDRLPIPPEPRGIDVPGIWFYDDDRDEVVASDRSTRGLSYVLTVNPRELTADGLRADTAGSPPDAEAYLAVPATEHEADIRALATEIASEATTTYDQAVALQSYLRSAQNFTYSTQLGPPLTTDAVWDFLTDRNGYCVQFATAMTIMARTLGIPARMAVGFLPGQPDDEVPGRYLVSGRQAHTWPELYFEDAGWVRFEPTPARQTGAPPVYADPLAGLPVPEDEVPTSTALPSSPPSTATVPGGGGGRPGHVGIGEADVPVLVVVGTIAVLMVGLAALIVVLRRRRARAAMPHGPDEWWSRLRERLAGYGVVWTDATTPRQAAQVVRERLPGVDLADPRELARARGALDDLVAAVETERYTTRTPSWSAQELRGWVEDVERPLTTVGSEGSPED